MGRRRIREACLIVTAFLFVFALTSCAGEPRTAPYVILATTTSVGNSGLLHVLLRAFQQQRALQVRPHLVGSGLALRMLEMGNADIVISHAPAAEASALRAHPSWRYRKIMFNDFVIVGPLDDPAHVKGATDAAMAMRRIALSVEKFVSRGDRSGTHEREETLWKLAGARPERDRLFVTGTGMGATLRIASEIGAYTLTDRATSLSTRDLQLVIVCDGGPVLVNTYAIIFDSASPHAMDALVLFDWVSLGDGRNVIHEYRLGGAKVFFPWPEGQPREDPHALPRSPVPFTSAPGAPGAAAWSAIVGSNEPVSRSGRSLLDRRSDGGFTIFY